MITFTFSCEDLSLSTPSNELPCSSRFAAHKLSRPWGRSCPVRLSPPSPSPSAALFPALLILLALLGSFLIMLPYCYSLLVPPFSALSPFPPHSPHDFRVLKKGSRHIQGLLCLPPQVWLTLSNLVGEVGFETSELQCRRTRW